MYYGKILIVRNFFFQAEDGIRDRTVTGVQTCALPILEQAIFTLYDVTVRILDPDFPHAQAMILTRPTGTLTGERLIKIGRASSREREENSEVSAITKEKFTYDEKQVRLN